MSTEQQKQQSDLTAFDRQAAAAKEHALEVSAGDLERYLGAQDDVSGAVSVSEVRNLTEGAGASNGIIFFKASIDGQPERELVLRYATDTPLIKQKRFSDEFQTMAAARAAGLPVPEVLWLDEAGAQLGRPSCITERVRGESPPSSLFTAGIFAAASPQDRKAMMLEAAAFHGKLRRSAIGSDRASHLVTRGEGETAIERELNWWFEEARLANPVQEQLDFLDDARRRMIAQQPNPYEAGLVHGDAQFANAMYRDGHIVAMLDWELAYLGHNEADLAVLVLFSETLNPADAPVEGVPTEAEFIEAYETAAGASVSDWQYFKAFALMKVATAMVFGGANGTMPGADELFAFYGGLYGDALDRI